MSKKSKNTDVVDVEETPVIPENAIGKWKVNRYLKNTESFSVAKGVTVGISGEAPHFEINVVGNKTDHICGTVEEARNKAKELMRDFLESALVVLKEN